MSTHPNARRVCLLVNDATLTIGARRCQALRRDATQRHVHRCSRLATVEVRANYLYLCRQHAMRYVQGTLTRYVT